MFVYSISRHVSNLFTALPTNSAQHLIPELSSPDEASTVHRTYEGHDVSAIAEILRYLEVVLEGTSLASQKEQLLPVVACLTILAKSHRAIRKYCRLRVSVLDEISQIKIKYIKTHSQSVCKPRINRIILQVVHHCSSTKSFPNKSFSEKRRIYCTLQL